MKAVCPKFAFSSKWFLFVPVTLYFVLSFVYLFAIPIGESPDEPGHLQCIEQVARYNRIPITQPEPEGDEWWERGRIVSGQMCYHMPFYYLVGGTLQRSLAWVAAEPLPVELPPNNPEWGVQAGMFAHSDKSSFLTIPEPVTLIGLRLLSMGLGAVTLWATYVVARQIFPAQEAVAVMAATIVAGWPQFLYMSRAINNDVPATALAVATLAVLLQAGRPNRFIIAAALAGLAVFTKLSMSFTVGVVCVAWLLELLRQRQPRWPYIRAMLICIALWTGEALLLWLHPTLRLHVQQSALSFAAIPAAAWTGSYWGDVFLLTLSSGWARLGWMNLPAPVWHAYIWWAGIGLTTASGVYLALRQQSASRQRLLLLIVAAWWAGVAVAYVRINFNRFQPQFRFALAVLPLLATFSAAGCLSWLTEKPRWQVGAILLLSLVLVGYNLWFVFTVVGPAYGWY